MTSKFTWRELVAAADRYQRWFVDTDPAVAFERLVERHLRAGIEPSYDAAAARVLENDAPNGELIRSRLILPTLVIPN